MTFEAAIVLASIGLAFAAIGWWGSRPWTTKDTEKYKRRQRKLTKK